MFRKICKPLLVYQFYCMVLFHSQVLRHMIIFFLKLTEKDCREWKLMTVDPQERSTWRSGVRSAMHAASQLPGRGPTDVDDAPAPVC